MSPAQIVQGVRTHLANLYRLRSQPCGIHYMSNLHNCRAKLDRLSDRLDRATHYRYELALMHFERRRLKARFENHCTRCGLYTGTIRRICDVCMPVGHERQQESAHIKRTSPDLPIPRPRYCPEAKHPQTSSQRFLRRFNAGDTLADTNTTSRAMKNPPFPAHQQALPLPQGDTVSVSPNGERAAPASQGPTDVSRSPFGETETVLPPGTTVSGSSCFGFPPAYVPSPKVGGFSFSSPAPTQLVLLELQGDLFLSDSSDLDRPGVSLDLVPGTRFRTLSGLVFRVAVLVTPPLSPMGGTFPQKPLYARTVKRGSDAS